MRPNRNRGGAERGFRHNGRIVYAVQYQLESSPPSWRIVWIDEYGESLRPWVRPAHAGKRMAAVNPGDEIVHRGIAYEVAGVWIYRALSQTPGREVVG